MTNSNVNTDPTTPGQEGVGPDPRASLATVIAEVDRLIEGTGSDQLGLVTPCPEFTVKELNEHLVLVLRRIAAIGRGEHWSSVSEEPVEGGWLDDFRTATAEIERVWADPAMLAGEYEVPWGVLPAVPVLLSYVAEIATHAWDLATATGQELTVADEVLAPSLGVLQFGLPAEGRDDPEMPFDPVVDPGPGAPVVLQIAGWLGRKVA
ncbi:MAG: TIGR03086 family metal-binding protein [Actinomycetota bacterium]